MCSVSLNVIYKDDAHFVHILIEQTQNNLLLPTANTAHRADKHWQELLF